MSTTYLTVEELSARLKLKPSTLQSMRNRGGGPRYIKAGHRTVLYALEDVEEWEKRRKFNNTAEEKTAKQ